MSGCAAATAATSGRHLGVRVVALVALRELGRERPTDGAISASTNRPMASEGGANFGRQPDATSPWCLSRARGTTLRPGHRPTCPDVRAAALASMAMTDALAAALARIDDWGADHAAAAVVWPGGVPRPARRHGAPVRVGVRDQARHGLDRAHRHRARSRSIARRAGRAARGHGPAPARARVGAPVRGRVAGLGPGPAPDLLEPGLRPPRPARRGARRARRSTMRCARTSSTRSA